MSFVTADDVRQSDGVLVVAPGARLTPLALDLARELGVEIRNTDRPAPRSRTGTARSTTSAATGSVAPVALDDPTAPSVPADVNLPPSGAMYRRHTPLRAGIDRNSNPARPTHPAARRPKAGVVGAGHVGAMTALRLAECNLFSEVAMLDVSPGLAAGLALDIWHGSGLCGFDTRLVGSEDASVLEGAKYVVVTAGKPRQPGMTRTDLTETNAAIVRSVGESIARHAPDAVVVVVTNPLEEMTHVMAQVTGFPDHRVLGMAGVLDTTRFCSLVGLTGIVAPNAVTAYAMGSHGPEMVVPLSQATGGGRPLEELLDAETLDAIVERTRDSGAEVVGLLKTGSAYFSPAESAAAMVRAMVNQTGAVMTACVRSNGAYGLTDSRIGLPVRLGPNGLDEIVTLDLRPRELAALREAAERIAERIASVGSQLAVA